MERLGGIFSGFPAEGVGGGVEGGNYNGFILYSKMNDMIPPLLDVDSKRFSPGGRVVINDELDKTTYENMGYRYPTFEDIKKKKQDDKRGGSRRRRVRPSRKYKKSAKRVFRKKSRSTRRR